MVIPYRLKRKLIQMLVFGSRVLLIQTLKIREQPWGQEVSRSWNSPKEHEKASLHCFKQTGSGNGPLRMLPERAPRKLKACYWNLEEGGSHHVVAEN